VKVFCQIHSHVAPPSWCSTIRGLRSDEQGGSTLSAVPPGMHQIRPLHERLGDTTLRVRVEPGRAAIVDFVLPVPAQP
jgi:hypothetical protein